MKSEIVGAVVIPAFNEAPGIENFLRQLSEELNRFVQHRTEFCFQIVLVDDGSFDNTCERVQNFWQKSQYSKISVEIIRFTKNFGHQAALVAGLQKVCDTTDFSITIDADGEQPISLIPTLIEHWLRSRTIIHTKRAQSKQIGLFKRLSSFLFYRLIRFSSGIEISEGMADFKLWDHHILRQARNFLPNCGSTRIFATWIAPNGPVVEYEQLVVENRVSRFSLKKMVRMALRGFVQYSELPLRFSFIFGVVTLSISMIFAIYTVFSYLRGTTVPGWASLILLVTFFGGVNAVLTGLLSEYLLHHSFRNKFPMFVTLNSKQD